MENKKCAVCLEVKDIEEFYKRGEGKRDNYCKPCRREYKRLRRNSGIEKEKSYTCISCKEKLPRKEFSEYTTGNRKSICNYCLDDNIQPFESWYNRNKDKPSIVNFLKNLREVTGINGEEDLLKKYRKY